jgi:hypothetical protein
MIPENYTTKKTGSVDNNRRAADAAKYHIQKRTELALRSSIPSPNAQNGGQEQYQRTEDSAVSEYTSTGLLSRVNSSAPYFLSLQGNPTVYVQDEEDIADIPPHTQVNEESCHPFVGTMTQPNTLPGKRSGPSDRDGTKDRDGHLPKRSCRRRMETQKAKKARETSALLDLLLKEELGHAYPRYCRDKSWEVDDLADVRLAKDGSVCCIVRWKPSEVKSTALVGEKLQKRLEEMFKKKYGADEWVRWCRRG